LYQKVCCCFYGIGWVVGWVASWVQIFTLVWVGLGWTNWTDPRTTLFETISKCTKTHQFACGISVPSERYVVNAQLLRSHFRLSVCDARELCVNTDFCRIYIHQLISQGSGSKVKKLHEISATIFSMYCYVEGDRRGMKRIVSFGQYLALAR